jgi:hypothetical protein
MSSYVSTTDDNGGVHINSGIPNRAFYLAASELGGRSWEQAGHIWYTALTSSSVRPSTDFASFAQATIAAASSSGVDGVVSSAWREVGVVASELVEVGAGTGGETASGGRPDPDGRVVVRRSGGFAGMVVSGQVELGSDPRTSEIQQLLSRINLRSVGSAPPQPDRFVYSFWVSGEEVVVGEQELTPELSRLAHLVLDD